MQDGKQRTVPTACTERRSSTSSIPLDIQSERKAKKQLTVPTARTERRSSTSFIPLDIQSERRAKIQLTVPTARTNRRSATSPLPLDIRSSSDSRGAKPKVAPTSTTKRKLPFSPALTLRLMSECAREAMR